MSLRRTPFGKEGRQRCLTWQSRVERGYLPFHVSMIMLGAGSARGLPPWLVSPALPTRHGRGVEAGLPRP
eukprot:3418874-Alexandrium_andersonii.AAC.1